MHLARERRIEMIRRRLLRESMPRFQMSLILLFTGLSGFLVSFSLLHLQVFRMWARYPIAILIAYCVFLLLLRVWLWVHVRQLKVDLDPSGLDFISADYPGSGDSSYSGGRGGSSEVSSNSTALDFLGLDLDLDLGEGCLIVVALIALIGGLVASLYVVYIAPALLAEILIDGVLLVGLYRRVKQIEQRHWLRAAVRRTLLPALLCAMCFALAGYAMQKAVPDAHSIGDVWKHITRSE